MFEFIIHYKNGESVRHEFATHEAYWEHLTEFAHTQEATPDISISWVECGAVLPF